MSDRVAELDERSPIYAGLGTAAAERRRAAVFAGLARSGLPEVAIPYVVETLSTELNPELVAGAAVAVRGLADARPEIASALVRALGNLRGRDGPVTVDGRPSTAVLEVLAALRWQPVIESTVTAAVAELTEQQAATWSPAVRRAAAETLAVLRTRDQRNRLLALRQAQDTEIPAQDTENRGLALRQAQGAEGCGLALRQAQDTEIPAQETEDRGLTGVVVEDQLGRAGSLIDFLRAARTVVAFFYTRCQNPNKCSLTITKLGDLQRSLDDHGVADVQLAAISYDPGFDRPDRLAAYARARRLVLSDRVRMFRAVAHHDRLRAWFELHVGYNGSIVNQHAVEVFLVEPDLTIGRSWSRVAWTIEEVVAALRSDQALPITHQAAAVTSNGAGGRS